MRGEDLVIESDCEWGLRVVASTFGHGRRDPLVERGTNRSVDLRPFVIYAGLAHPEPDGRQQTVSLARTEIAPRASESLALDPHLVVDVVGPSASFGVRDAYRKSGADERPSRL